MPIFNYHTGASPRGGDTATLVLEQGLGAISYRTEIAGVGDSYSNYHVHSRTQNMALCHVNTIYTHMETLYYSKVRNRATIWVLDFNQFYTVAEILVFLY